MGKLVDCQNFLLFLTNIYHVKNWNLYDSGQWSCTWFLLYTSNLKLLKLRACMINFGAIPVQFKSTLLANFGRNMINKPSSFVALKSKRASDRDEITNLAPKFLFQLAQKLANDGAAHAGYGKKVLAGSRRKRHITHGNCINFLFHRRNSQLFIFYNGKP